MLQFNLVMGCGQPYRPHMDNQVKLEYSTNHGLTWHLVQEVSSHLTLKHGLLLCAQAVCVGLGLVALSGL